MTFVPSFLFIFLGAPYVERLRGNRTLRSALDGVTAAIVGVIANLALFFAVHTLFSETRTLGLGPVLPRAAGVVVVRRGRHGWWPSWRGVLVFVLEWSVLRTLGRLRSARNSCRLSGIQRVTVVEGMTTTVDFWFDPLCPFAWITSRTMLEAEKVRDIEVTWHIMIAGLPQRGQGHLRRLPRARLKDAWQPVRVCMAVEQEYGQEKLAELYTALGTRKHTQGREKLGPALIEEALAEIGVPVALADAMDDDSYDDAIRKSHHAGMDQVGDEVGNPDHRHRRPGLLRPGAHPDRRVARTPAGSGTRAVTLSSFPYFAELKRTRERDARLLVSPPGPGGGV